MGIYDKLLEEILNETQNNMIEAAKSLLADANEVVPIQTGNLKSSGRITIAQDNVSVVYDADYALDVHENPDGTGYKWLERTADLNEDKYVEIIAGGGK